MSDEFDADTRAAIERNIAEDAQSLGKSVEWLRDAREFLARKYRVQR